MCSSIISSFAVEHQQQHLTFSIEGPRYTIIIGHSSQLAEMLPTGLNHEELRAAMDPDQVQRLVDAISSQLPSRGTKRPFEEATTSTASSKLILFF